MRFHRNVYILAITSFLTDVSSEMLHNVLPLFLVNVLGAGTAVVGLIDGIAETTASLVKVFSGRLSDYWQKRKSLAVLGYALSSFSKPFLYFASSWNWVLSVRFADRIGKGIRTAPRDALIAASVEDTQRGRAFGLHRAGDTAGAFTGILAAMAIICIVQSGKAQLTRHAFQLIVIVSILPALLAVVILAIGAREMDQRQKTEEARQLPRESGKKFDQRFRRFMLVIVLFTLGNSSDSFLILRAQERGLNVLQILGVMLTFNAVYSVLSGPLGSLSDRFGRRRLILGGWFVYALCYLGFAVARSGTQIWFLFGLYGFFYALTEGIARAYVADLVPQEQHGTAYGYFNAAVGITALPASLAAGVLWQGLGRWSGFGPSAPFLFGAALALAAGLLFGFWVPSGQLHAEKKG
jgi:MFS family permease